MTPEEFCDQGNKLLEQMYLDMAYKFDAKPFLICSKSKRVVPMSETLLEWAAAARAKYQEWPI